MCFFCRKKKQLLEFLYCNYVKSLRKCKCPTSPPFFWKELALEFVPGGGLTYHPSVTRCVILSPVLDGVLSYHPCDTVYLTTRVIPYTRVPLENILWGYYLGIRAKSGCVDHTRVDTTGCLGTKSCCDGHIRVGTRVYPGRYPGTSRLQILGVLPGYTFHIWLCWSYRVYPGAYP